MFWLLCVPVDKRVDRSSAHREVKGAIFSCLTPTQKLWIHIPWQSGARLVRRSSQIARDKKWNARIIRSGDFLRTPAPTKLCSSTSSSASGQYRGLANTSGSFPTCPDCRRCHFVVVYWLYMFLCVFGHRPGNWALNIGIMGRVILCYTCMSASRVPYKSKQTRAKQ